MHHIQPDLFKQLNPKAKTIEIKSNLKFDEVKKALEQYQDETEGVGYYIIEAVKVEKGIDRVVDNK